MPEIGQEITVQLPPTPAAPAAPNGGYAPQQGGGPADAAPQDQGQNPGQGQGNANPGTNFFDGAGKTMQRMARDAARQEYKGEFNRHIAYSATAGGGRAVTAISNIRALPATTLPAANGFKGNWKAINVRSGGGLKGLSFGRVLGVVGVALVGVSSYGRSLNEDKENGVPKDHVKAASRAVGNMAAVAGGAWAGAKIGAVVGAFGGPVGAIIGGGIGAFAGGLLGGLFGDKIGDGIHNIGKQIGQTLGFTAKEVVTT